MTSLAGPVLQRAMDAVSGDRIAARLEELSWIGRDESGGVTRLALSKEEQAARELVSTWLTPLGYRCTLDEAANLVALTPRDSGILVGSHLDTVPSGGAYDGALGVVVAVEVAEVLATAGAAVTPRVVAWMGEEGPRFGRTLLGSAAAVGLLDTADWDRSSNGRTVRQLADEARQQWPDDQLTSVMTGVRAYLELHMEQGPLMAERGIPVAVVSTIAGVTHFALVVHGEANHAGTTMMRFRKDALAGAAEMLLEAERSATEAGDRLVVTCGNIAVEPGAQNVIPGRVTLRFDVRAPSDAHRQSFVSRYISACREVAGNRGLRVDATIDSEIPSVALDPNLRQVLAESLRTVGHAHHELTSGAVHDAQSVALAGYPTGMLFVRSTGGSHNPGEHVASADAAVGVQALVQAIAHLS